MRALGNSLRAFENGHDYEASRIAVAVATLVYTHRRTKGILDHLGVKSRIKFWVSGHIEHDGNLITEFPLTASPVPQTNEFKTRWSVMSKRVGFSYNTLPFDLWWTAPVIKTGGWVEPPREDAQRAMVLTRKDIIMTFRDQDGGAHYDSQLSLDAYAELKQEGTGWALQSSDGKREVITGVLEATAAQIGHEVMTSLLNFYPEIPTDIGL
jgi:hypothetical protein